MEARPFEVLRPRKFCKDECRTRYRNESKRALILLGRRCPCGGTPANQTGVPVCASCKEAKRARDTRSRTLRPYGLTVERYDELLASQGGRCAVCGSKDSGREGKPLVVDHCHETGAVRGILCFPCNTAVGMVRDDERIAKRLHEYIATRATQLRLAV